MSYRIFFPPSSKDFAPQLLDGQGYRHPFGDLRLSRRHDKLLSRMSEKRTAIIHQLSDDSKDTKGAYRFLEKVDLAELIYQTTRIAEQQIGGKDLLVNIDRSAFNVKLGNSRFRSAWAKELGVLEDNRSPVFFAMPALVLERTSQHCLG